MYKYLLFFVGFLPLFVSAQTPSPTEFLGYEPGQKFTPWHKVVQYFEIVSKANPDKIQFKEYGKTYEGRPLVMAVVSSPENMNRIEEIRTNNLRVTGMLEGATGITNEPVIVWMSYNVHGNEASSTEVAMVMLYDLVSGKKAEVNSWLKNTVVILNPCLNPDGRDRYVNWFQSISGKNPDASMLARERFEPFVAGRSNHYYFDLNRDWAWQSQEETKHLVKLYNEWMPAIHVDFHEQYYNSPYYFAPAAEPIHHAVSDFQKSFQEEIGRNHAKYFDNNGWLYFTREYFDLFYPSYGDTYPMFNGAIGMTYEQAGHSMGGLVISWDDETLTLKDRIAHHYTTGMSTIEVASKNAQKINTAFKKYFTESNQQGSGVYKTYVLDGSNASKTAGMLDLLDRNGIKYTVADKKVQVKGFDYFERKEMSWTVKENDIIISTLQPKATLVRVLFEPTSALNDSLTYDITAWALPYAHGIPAIALKEKLSIGKAFSGKKQTISVPNGYAYLINYTSFNDAKVLAALLKSGVKVRFHENDFEVNGKKYAKGTMLILNHENNGKAEIIRDILTAHNAGVEVLESGMMQKGADFGSDKVRNFKMPKIGVLAGDQAFSNSLGEIWHYFDQQLDFPVTMINSNNANNISLSKLDILIVPSGSFKFLSEKEGNNVLKDWISNGGKLIVIENAVFKMSDLNWGLKTREINEKAAEEEIITYADRDRAHLKNFVQGAIFKVDLDYSHPIAFGFNAPYFTLKNSNNVYEYLKDGWNVGVIKQNAHVAGMIGSNAAPLIKNMLSVGSISWGRGNIVFFTDNPLYRSFWESGKHLFANAIFYNW